MIDLKISEAKEKESVREYAYRVLRENILNLTLVPGTAVSEKEISDILSISRTPAREAFIRLAQEGLLEILPQRGSYISKIDTEQIAEFRFLRVTMEQAVIRLACRYFPDEFKRKLIECLEEQRLCVANKNYERFFKLDNMMHDIIFTGCEKPHIWKIIQEANLNYIRARVLDLSSKQSEIELLFSQHEEIVKSIINADEELGYEIITKHVNKVISDVHELQEKYIELFK
ncbi:GntR family transcriptional regulator [Pectinatus haikarae]|uniref:DNA-binding GntR family transcriptional regulator n=1 Tax=Pectinatus haikarae TaxID=349096 RepID=A0ABT9Y826_9FIRM|nr:GntR family transcriptional regulator [Pectinatus haikarae]MDQ0203988.1 DNA-binding GntR family transcriptional regulator [Pectinatus haikarae]